MKSQHKNAPSNITVGELCQAIGDHRIPTQRKNDDYLVRGSDLRRLARASGSARSLRGLHSRRPAC
jgi:hypothetical protein